MHPTADSTQPIRELAYKLWQQRGCRHGRALEDWLEAERLLTTQRASGPPIEVAEPPETEVDSVEPEVPKVASRDAPGG